MNRDQHTHLKMPYIPPRITEKTKLKIDIQTNSVPDGGYHIRKDG